MTLHSVMRDDELRMSWASREGMPSPLGATWSEEEHAYNFALYSAHSWGVTLLLYAELAVTRAGSGP